VKIVVLIITLLKEKVVGNVAEVSLIMSSNVTPTQSLISTNVLCVVNLTTLLQTVRRLAVFPLKPVTLTAQK
jgi:hypothetical protein